MAAILGVGSGLGDRPGTVESLAALDVVGRRAKIDIKIVQMLVRFAKQAHEIIDRNWTAVQQLTDELVRNKMLSGNEIEQITSHAANERRNLRRLE